MGIKIREALRVNQKFKNLEKDLKLIKESAEYTKGEMEKINNHLDVVVGVLESKKVLGDAPLISDWAHVEDITEADRYPLVKTSEQGIEVEAQVLLKKLDII